MNPFSGSTNLERLLGENMGHLTYFDGSMSPYMCFLGTIEGLKVDKRSKNWSTN